MLLYPFFFQPAGQHAVYMLLMCCGTLRFQYVVLCCVVLQALVWSAVAASSSFPGLYPPQYLLGRNSLGEHIK